MSNEALKARVRAKMAARAAAKDGKKNAGKAGFFNLTDESGKTDKEGVWVSEIRLLPTSLVAADSDPLKSVHLHYKIGGKESFVCLKEQFGQECAACNMLEPLWDSSREAGEKKGDYGWELAKKFYPSERFYSPGIRRFKGKIVEGSVPEWYGYNESRQDEIMEWIMDEDIGDITDITSGTDLRVTRKDGKVTGSQYGTVTQQLRPGGPSKLGSKKEAQDLIDKIPDLLGLHNVWTAERIQTAVDSFLNSQLSDDGSEGSESKYGAEPKSTADEVDEKFAALQNQ